MKRIVPSDETYPLSRNERSWVLFSSRGSPVPSAATASSSSNGGAMKRSRRLIGRDFRLVLVVLLLLATPILPTVPPPPPPPPLPTPPPGLVERGVGKSAKKKTASPINQFGSPVWFDRLLTDRESFPVVQKLLCNGLDMLDQLFYFWRCPNKVDLEIHRLFLGRQQCIWTNKGRCRSTHG